MREAEKESLVNQIFDLRQLLRIVNEEGELKVANITKKNVSSLWKTLLCTDYLEEQGLKSETSPGSV